VRMPETEIFPKPIQKPGPPIWLGGSGPRAMELIASYADGWLPTWFTPDGYRERIPALYTAAREHGRPDAHFTIGNEIVACIAKTDKEAHDLSGPTLETLSSGFMVRTAEEAAASALVGSPATIAQRVRAFHEAGVDHFELKFIYRSVDQLLEQMEVFSREVIPAVR
jgi:alkanesulfonate monooxygenase SsuD/methylene tetrahydromethanopterin reductase-like flavin-dependent oxidoreductase (luciferase family)